MKAISSTQANREFSRLLREVADGEAVQITSHGRPVATLAPIDLRPLQRRQAAKAGLLERLARQAPSGVSRDWSRDELYE
ncbi:MAG: hypothetical protein RL722_2737 [Pseudomonadota bacterium]|jgi:prevent-host-death family protein